MMKALTRNRLKQALRRLGELADAEGVTLELCVYGGSAMMLAYNTRQATKDVEPEKSVLIAELIQEVWS